MNTALEDLNEFLIDLDTDSIVNMVNRYGLNELNNALQEKGYQLRSGVGEC